MNQNNAIKELLSSQSLHPSASSLKLDYSSKNTSHECLRKYFLQYICDLRSNYGSSALRYGSTWHATMEAFYQYIKENGWTKDGMAISAGVEQARKTWEEETAIHPLWYDDYRSLPNLLQSFIRYVDHFAADENHLEVVHVEKPFKVAMPLSPTDQLRFPHLEPFWFTGIMDMEVFYDGRYWQLDHKTTGQPIATQQNRLQRSAQSIGYFYAGGLVFPEKPDGHFITIHHLSAYKSKKTGEYGDPKIDFSRVPMLYSEDDIASWKDGFMEAAQRLQIAHRTGVFPCEHGSCYTYGRCGFSNICDLNLSEDEIKDKADKGLFPDFFQGEHWDPAKNL